MEKYSVLMSLYKKEHPDYLRLALDSMINQTIKPDEIVLVEDGPLTDELYAVVEEYKPYLTIVINETNLGLGLALNKGLNNCRNELVARMDTDDISIKNRCEKQLNYFELHPETTVLGGQIAEFISSPEEIIGKRIVPETDKTIKTFMKKRCPFNHMTVMFKKNDILKAGNYQDLLWNEDYYLWIRLAELGFSFANLSEVLVNAHVCTDTYQRRGGKKYFLSEIRIQQVLLNKQMIGFGTYVINILKRIIVELLLPARVRSWFFCHFARTQ